MKYLLALKALISYNHIPKEVIQSTMDHILKEYYLKEVQKHIDNETDEHKKDELTKKYAEWVTLLGNNVWVATAASAVSFTKGKRFDKSTKRDIYIEEQHTEDYVADVIAELYSKPQMLTDKAPPLTSNPKNLVNLYRAIMQNSIIDLARHDARSSIGQGMGSQDEEGNKNVVEKLDDGGKNFNEHDEQFIEIVKDFENYVKKKSLNEIQKELLDVWVKSVESGKHVKISSIANEIAKKFNTTRQNVDNYLKELRKIAIDFFQKELGFTLPRDITEKYIMSSSAKKIAMEYKIAYETLRRNAARFVLGSTYFELQSGKYVSPKAMVKALVKRRMKNATNRIAISRTEAIKKDKSFYADMDDDSNMWCVFGDNSGFAYASYADKDEAKRKADEMNKNKKSGK